jgi:signal transduction histidine kinase
MQTRIGMVGGSLTSERNSGPGVSVSCAAPKKS